MCIPRSAPWTPTGSGPITRRRVTPCGYALQIAEVTTDDRNLYRNDFGGTSSAAPIVSGVAALVRGANPSLTWRDVKLILAASAMKNDPSNTGWETGALRYDSATKKRYSYNPEYGFGVVDAGAAVELAESWTNLPPMKWDIAESGENLVERPPTPATGVVAQVTSKLTVGSNVGFTEFVEVHIDFDYASFRDLEVEILSPSGTVSKLAESYPGGSRRSAIQQVPFRVGASPGRRPPPAYGCCGWSTTLPDRALPEGAAAINEWSIKVYGHGEGVAKPPPLSYPAAGEVHVVGTAQVGETLTADTVNIVDWDGLNSATFSYQWISNDGTADTEINGATATTYTLTPAETGPGHQGASELHRRRRLRGRR